MSLSYRPSSALESKGPCPRCRSQGKDKSGDNLATYGDGHSWCYSCKLFIPPPSLEGVKAISNELIRESKGVHLPEDASSTIDFRALNWLHQYDIKRDEIVSNDLMWSPQREYLIFPIRDSQRNLLAWQARTFSKGAHLKWLTFGEVESLTHLIGDAGNAIIVVEDIVSAIKVARHCTAMPLFGSHMSLKRLNLLRHMTREIKLWLDADKYTESIRFSRVAEKLGLKASCIYTQDDPKACSDSEIETAIGGS